jgi:phage shock protein PspC (stress-responsive transcriptional regulator)
MTQQPPSPPDAGSHPHEQHGTGHPAGPQGPRVGRDEMRDVGRLRRPVDDRMVAGVCSGLARHFDVDPVIVRVAVVVLAFFGGAGLLLYVAGWVLVPEEGSDQAPLGLDDRNRGIALVGVAALAALMMFGDWSGAFWFPWPLLVVALVVYLVVSRSRRGPAGYVPPRDGEPGRVTYATAPAGPAPGEAPEAAYGVPSGPAYGAPWAYPPPPPPRPRKPGPVLFWATLALVALGIGVLGLVDVAGVPVVDSAYPALALGTIAVMLVVGAFWGRAGGLIALGLVAATATAATAAVGHFEGERVDHRPTSATAVLSDYDLSRGELVVDLTDVRDVEELDGRELRVDVEVGRIEVVLPEGLDVEADAVVRGPGSIRLFDDQTGGIDIARHAGHDGGIAAPELSVVTDMSVGETVVRVEQD